MSKRVRADGVPTIDPPQVPEACLARGPVGCGKTQALVEEARRLVERGAEPGDVLMVCATPDAARSARRRLDEAGAAGVRAASAWELALEVLAQAEGGRAPRVLLPYEEDVLFEDLKVGGVEPGRLGGMLAFFRRSMTEVSDDHPDFVMDDEEQDALDRIHANLALWGGARMRAQVSADAARALARHEAGMRFRHVLVDDYQSLCRASQVMACLLARESVFVAADPDARDQAFEGYPYAAGVDELLRANPAAQVQELGEFLRGGDVLGAVNRLRAEAGEGPLSPAGDLGASDAPGAPGAVGGGAAAEHPALEVLGSPEEEVARAAELAASWVGGGMAPGEIYLVSPARRWDEGLVRELSRRGVPCVTACDARGLASGDVRDLRGSAHLRVLTALLLAGDPDDGVSWRCWCAFGDHLAGSNVFDAVRRFAQERRMGLGEALAWLADNGAAGLGRVSERDLGRVLQAYREGRALAERARGLRGAELLGALAEGCCGTGAPVPPQTAALCAGAPEGADAAGLRGHVLAQVSAPGWRDPAGTPADVLADAVHVGPMGRLCGLSPRGLVLAGFVNGIFPFPRLLRPDRHPSRRRPRRAPGCRPHSLRGRRQGLRPARHDRLLQDALLRGRAPGREDRPHRPGERRAHGPHQPERLRRGRARRLNGAGSGRVWRCGLLWYDMATNILRKAAGHAFVRPDARDEEHGYLREDGRGGRRAGDGDAKRARRACRHDKLGV